MLAREHLLALCPKAKESYLAAITDPDWGVGMMQRFEILASQKRLTYFLASGFHETGALTIEAENMNYSAARMRVVWPSRFKTKTDAELAHLVNNPDALASEVYNGRMGNRPGSSDGGYFRGRGFLQVTGRSAYLTYGPLIGIDFNTQPEYVESMQVMFAMSCAEVWHDKLNQIADEGDFDGYCAKLNVGDRRRVAACVGLDSRRKWLERVEKLFAGHPEAAEPPEWDIDALHRTEAVA